MGGRRRGSSTRAYGVAVTFLPHKGGAVPESERRRAAWRTTEPSHTCSWLLLRCPISSSLSRLGGAAGGRAVRRGVCVCATASKDRPQRTIGFVLLTTKALSKKIDTFLPVLQVLKCSAAARPEKEKARHECERVRSPSCSSKFLFAWACGSALVTFQVCGVLSGVVSGWRRVCVFPSSREPTRRQTLGIALADRALTLFLPKNP